MKPIILHFNSPLYDNWECVESDCAKNAIEKSNSVAPLAMTFIQKCAFVLWSFFLISSSFSFTQLKAQDGSTSAITDIRDRLCFGFKAGLNYSNVFDERGEEFVADPKFGAAFGAFAAIPIGTYFGIQPEFLYSQKGFKSTGAVLGQRYELIRTTNYIDVPLFFSFKPGEFISFLAGFQYSYLVKQVDEIKSNSGSTQQVIQFDNSDVRKHLLGAAGGVDFTMKHFVLGGRVGADFLRNVGSGNAEESRYKNFWFQATIAYRFYAN